MKNFKNNILKMAVGMACVVLPIAKMHAQTDKKSHSTGVGGFGVVYTPPLQCNASGYGISANIGYAVYTKMLDTDLNCCAMFLFDGGASRFDTKINKYRYNASAFFKLGIEYRRIAFMATKGCGLVLDNSGYVQVADIHGVGIDITVAPHTKIYIDCLHSNPSLQKKLPQEHKAAHQKYSMRTGVLFTLSHKKRAR